MRHDTRASVTPRRWRTVRRLLAVTAICVVAVLLQLSPIPRPPRVHAAPLPPTITASAYATQGSACPNCRVDVYSTGPGDNYYGAVMADGTGFWSTEAPVGLPVTYAIPVGGPFVYATATDATGTSAPSALFPAQCTGPICVTGQYEATYFDNVSQVFNHCTAYVHQIGDGSSGGITERLTARPHTAARSRGPLTR
jgi:hypothetical protein